MAFSRQTKSHLAHGLGNQASATEILNLLDVATKGTAEASKVVSLDASKGITGITTLTATTVTATNLNVGANSYRAVGLAYSNTAAATTVGGTSAETLFDVNYTIPANTLAAGTVVNVRYAGFGVTGSGTDTFAHKLYIGGSGGTAILTAGAAQLATNSTFTGECELICRTAGTTGTFVSFGTYKQSSAEGTMTVKDDYTASTTLNTQANQAVVVTGTWNNANTTSARLDLFRVEIA